MLSALLCLSVCAWGGRLLSDVCHWWCYVPSFLQRCAWIVSMQGSSVFMILWRAFFSAWAVLPYQTVMPVVRMLSASPLYAWVRGRWLSPAFLSSLMKWSRRWAFFTAAVVSTVPLRFAVTWRSIAVRCCSPLLVPLSCLRWGWGHSPHHKQECH